VIPRSPPRLRPPSLGDARGGRRRGEKRRRLPGGLRFAAARASVTDGVIESTRGRCERNASGRTSGDRLTGKRACGIADGISGGA
jgi:hypothetical protein